MKNIILFLITLFFISCNVSNFVYTLDDVYYSTPSFKERMNNNYVDLNDRYLYMKSRGNRWQTFDNDFYYWNFQNNRFNNWPSNYSYSPHTFNTWNYTQYSHWRNTNLFILNPNRNNTIVIKNNNRIFQSGPRQFNLSTYNNNNSNVITPTKKPTTSSSAPIRKFK